MTRQVAIGALIAFAVTVLGLSLWSPSGSKPPEAPPVDVIARPARDVRPSDRTVEVRQVTTIHPRVIQGLMLETPDAGATP